jgi:hypothetical protein
VKQLEDYIDINIINDRFILWVFPQVLNTLIQLELKDKISLLNNDREKYVYKNSKLNKIIV